MRLVLRKKHRDKFEKYTNGKRREELDLVHNDLCGIVRTPLQRGVK